MLNPKPMRNTRFILWNFLIYPALFLLMAPVYYPTFWLMLLLDKLVAGVEKIKCKFIKKEDHDTYNAPHHSASCSG